MDPYSSHLPLLRFLFLNLDIKNVLELGIGHHSTGFFRDQGVEELVSVEADGNWGKKMRDDGYPVVIGTLIDFVHASDTQYDLAFVDGNPASERAACVEGLFEKANIIVAHDTEPESNWNYHYDELILPEGFVRVDYTQTVPWTSVFTKDPEAIAVVRTFVGQ